MGGVPVVERISIRSLSLGVGYVDRDRDFTSITVRGRVCRLYQR